MNMTRWDLVKAFVGRFGENITDELHMKEERDGYDSDFLTVIEAAKRIQESSASEQGSTEVNDDCVLILVHMTYLDEVQARMKQWAEIDDNEVVHYLWGDIV
jgi:hypothetical protein